MTVLLALGVWQAGERRPMPAEQGTGLFPAPVARTAANVATGTATSTAIPSQPTRRQSIPLAERTTIRIGTYNIHSGIGTDRQFDLSRIAQIVQDEDIVGLNEVRGGTWLAQTTQAELLAAEVQSPWLFAPTESQWGRGHFGNGILCRRAVTEWKRIPLPGSRAAGHRNVLLVTLAHPKTPLTIMITHLDRLTDRDAQLREITKLFLSLPQPAALLGDLNTKRDDPLMTPLLDADDVEDALQARLDDDPADRIDWILTRGMYCVSAGMTAAGPSDHPHFWADFAWSERVEDDTAQAQVPDQVPLDLPKLKDPASESQRELPEQARNDTNPKL